MKKKIKATPGRPRIHELGKWTSVQFRLPIDLRLKLTQNLAQKNETLPYHLSLNSFLLELIQKGLDE